MNKEMLMSYGVDYERGLKNCMGNLPFYKKILSMFLADPCFSRASVACENGDQRELFTRMHELKGVSGNAALVSLYDAVAPLVELLRHGDTDIARVTEMFAAVDDAYKRACEGISRALSETE